LINDISLPDFHADDKLPWLASEGFVSDWANAVVRIIAVFGKVRWCRMKRAFVLSPGRVHQILCFKPKHIAPAPHTDRRKFDAHARMGGLKLLQKGEIIKVQSRLRRVPAEQQLAIRYSHSVSWYLVPPYTSGIQNKLQARNRTKAIGENS